MNRRTSPLTLTVALCVGLATPLPALAADGTPPPSPPTPILNPIDTGPGGGFTAPVVVPGSAQPGTGGTSSTGGPSGPVGPPPVAVFTWDVLGSGPDGPCRDTYVAPVYNGSDVHLQAAAAEGEQGLYDDATAGLGPIPACTGTGPTPYDFIAAAMAQVGGFIQLPDVSTDPGGKAITGAPLYVDTGLTELSYERGIPVTIAGLTYTVTGTFDARVDVTWAPGQVETDIGRTGGAYHPGEPLPNDVVHTYATDDDTTITVATTWDITLSLAGITRGATLGPFTDDHAVDVFEVRSVRDR